MATPRAARLGIFAAEDTSVQVAWGALGPGSVRLAAGDSVVDIEANGGPGVVAIGGLAPSRSGQVVLSGDGVPGGRRQLPYRTLAPPPGPELYRFATVSDLHLGTGAFGVFGRMREKPQPEELHPVRCTRAAFREASAWAAERIVVKGDVTNWGRLQQWQMFGELVAEVDLPVDALPGNHDVQARRDILPDEALVRIGLEPLHDGGRSIDVPGVRIVLVDTAVHERHHGRLEHLHHLVTDHVAPAPGPVWLAMHHQPERLPFRYFYPPGVGSRDARRFLDEIAAVKPAAFVTSGHTHRNRRWDYGPVVLTEVGSPKDYPGTWAGYVVHENGIRQVVRRVADPDCVPWIEYTRRAALTAWGRWSPGRLSDRCFTHLWPTG